MTMKKVVYEMDPWAINSQGSEWYFCEVMQKKIWLSKNANKVKQDIKQPFWVYLTPLMAFLKVCVGILCGISLCTGMSFSSSA